MRDERISGFLWVLVSFLMVFSLFFIWKPVSAEDQPLNRTGAEEVEPKEVLPSEPRIFPDDRDEVSDHLVYVGGLNAAYTLSHQEGTGDSVSGGDIEGLLAPRYSFSDRLSFTLMYNGNYQKMLDFYSDNVGPRERTEFQRHNISPMFRIKFGEDSRYFLVPSLFHTRTYNKDVEGGGWSDGLYNYRDYGGGLDFGVEDLGFGASEEGALRVGLQYYERHYPNYDSLLDLATGNSVEKDERDYKGILGKIGYVWRQKSGLSWGADYYVLYKMLDDKKVVDVPSGVLSSDDQRDYLHSLSGRMWYDILDFGSRLRLGMDLNGSLYDSNQNYYDGMGTIDPLDNVPIEDFYDYYSYSIRPNIIYTFATLPITSGVFYSYQRLGYRDRRAQFADGTYKSDKQYENQDVFGFDLRYNLRDNLSLYGQYQYVDVSSNNDNEIIYEYDHTIHYFYAGISIRL